MCKLPLLSVPVTVTFQWGLAQVPLAILGSIEISSVKFRVCARVNVVQLDEARTHSSRRLSLGGPGFSSAVV